MFDTALNYVIDTLPHLFLAAFLFSAFFITGRVLSKILRRITVAVNPDSKQVFSIVSRGINVIFIVLGLIAAFANLGINVAALVASIGFISLGLGYALKDVIANILSGLTLITYRPFKINDRISVNNHEGKVIKIDMRYVSIVTDQGNTILIPHSVLINNSVTLINSKDN